jgi:hypothetical protein
VSPPSAKGRVAVAMLARLKEDVELFARERKFSRELGFR